jgi:excisionase family DNA binding protein
VTEAAEMLGISRNFAYDLAKRGELLLIRLGNRIVIRRVALEKTLEQAAAPCKG